MEAISTSVPPSINLPKTHPKTHHFHHLKPPLLNHQNHHIFTTKHHTSISSTKPSTLSSHHKFTPLPSTSQPPPPPQTAHTHLNAATRYAAALVDAAICSDSLHGVYKDVKKLFNEMLKDVMSDVLIDDGVKCRVMKEVVVNGKLRQQVVTMVKMLVAKNRYGMVEQVMVEFERIYFELNCSSSSLKMVG